MQKSLPQALNIGTANGYSVREIVAEILTQANSHLEPVVVGRREGDPSILLADVRLSRELLGFTADLSLYEMVRSSI